ncbi:hypothetical protein IH992_21010 [Candidatus Poribacteria bacterium]|nr:hypothetical protein [Candidatus Poribacteria bacterium]
MRFRFLWWTLHPAGFALTGSTWTVGWLWFSIFISWFGTAGGVSRYDGTGFVIFTIEDGLAILANLIPVTLPLNSMECDI